MKNLFVGCRVRVIWADTPVLVGCEGRIIAAAGSNRDLVYSPRAHWHVGLDIWGGSDQPPASFIQEYNLPKSARFTPSSSDLEPILPSGQQAGNMSYQELMDSLQGVKV